MEDSQFWVFDWLSERGIKDESDLARVVTDRKLFNEFRFAAEQGGPINAASMGSGAHLVAGAGLDLTGAGSCSRPACIRKQVDELLHHAWLYFDKIRVVDQSPRFAKLTFRKLDNSKRQAIVGWLGALLYVKAVGADAMLEFAPVPRYCEEHWLENSRGFGLASVVDELQLIVDEALKSCTIEYRLTPNKALVNVMVSLAHFPITSVYSDVAITSLANRTADENARHFVGLYFKDALAQITSDLAKSAIAQTSLGTTSESSRFLLRHARKAQNVNTNSVAFSIDLPILNDVPTAYLVKIRREESALFNSFQDLLRKAIQERIKAGSEQEATSIAEQIVQDLIQPGVNEVRLALEKNQKSLNRNKLAGGLGVLATTVGALTHQPQAALYGSIACSAALGAILKAGQDRDTIESRPMYFLFKAIEHAAQH